MTNISSKMIDVGDLTKQKNTLLHNLIYIVLLLSWTYICFSLKVKKEKFTFNDFIPVPLKDSVTPPHNSNLIAVSSLHWSPPSLTSVWNNLTLPLSLLIIIMWCFIQSFKHYKPHSMCKRSSSVGWWWYKADTHQGKARSKFLIRFDETYLYFLKVEVSQDFIGKRIEILMGFIIFSRIQLEQHPGRLTNVLSLAAFTLPHWSYSNLIFFVLMRHRCDFFRVVWTQKSNYFSSDLSHFHIRS